MRIKWRKSMEGQMPIRGRERAEAIRCGGKIIELEAVRYLCHHQASETHTQGLRAVLVPENLLNSTCGSCVEVCGKNRRQEY